MRLHSLEHRLTSTLQSRDASPSSTIYLHSFNIGLTLFNDFISKRRMEDIHSILATRKQHTVPAALKSVEFVDG